MLETVHDSRALHTLDYLYLMHRFANPTNEKFGVDGALVDMNSRQLAKNNGVLLRRPSFCPLSTDEQRLSVRHSIFDSGGQVAAPLLVETRHTDATILQRQ